jgi:hypothetical protein
MTNGRAHPRPDLLLQPYGAQRYASHAPTRVHWLNLGAALLAAGVKLPTRLRKVGEGMGEVSREGFTVCPRT